MPSDVFLSIINRNADGILVIDQQGVIRFCNPAAEAMFGISTAALLGTVFGFPIVVGETTEIDILRNGVPTTAEMRVVELEWQGETAHLASLRDVTERKQAQAAIMLRNRAIEASASGIMIIQAGGVTRPLMYVNPAFEVITGYKTQDVIGRDAHFLYECNPDMTVNQTLDNALREGYEAACVVQCVRKDGSEYWSELRLSPIRDDNGTLTHIVGVQHDITDRKYLEAEQIETARIRASLDKERELRELKDRFLSMMSHELRTPLALIRLSHDMLHQYGRIAPEEERQQYLDSIRAQVEHLTEMINDVMTVSRAERMVEDFSPEIIDLITFCRDIVEEFQLSYSKTHRIVFECEARIVRASVDRRLLRQALTNLLGNAIKYSSEGSPILIRLDVDGRSAVIGIVDRGIGISDEDRTRLFEPFHRGHNVELIPGTGLGLAIVEQAVRAHGGSVQVESALGQGSTFRVSIPMVAVNGRG